MIRVKNQKAVAKLSAKSLRANRVRNAVAVFAIALTTMMFMTVFTIAGTMLHASQQETFRQVGTSGHGTFKDLTQEEKEFLEKDPMVKESGGRLFLGMGSGERFRKVHAELSYMEPGYLIRSFCEPEHGRAPEEGTKEIACDTRILKCLGVKPKAGAEVTITYEVGGSEKTQITDTFFLSGWWEYDPANMASMAVLPKSYVGAVVKQYPRKEDDISNTTGLWTLEIMLSNSMHIEKDMEEILSHYGCQSKDPSGERYITVGVNWAYAGAQLAENADLEMIAGVAVLLVLIIFTGYLIIYNVFQISVSGDIRFYGLLKTIGTTGKQIRNIIRRQALLLSVAGIPAGLIAGSLSGIALAPVMMSTLRAYRVERVMSPWFFIVSAVFSIVTVFLSCAKPGRMAAKVSPVEAVRYTDAAEGKRRRKKGRAGGKPVRMAWANLGRNRKKTVLAVISLTLAVALMHLTCTFANGFDMDKYLRPWVVSDFVVGDASYFQVGKDLSGPMPVIEEKDISRLKKGGMVTENGRIYGHRGNITVYAPQEAYRKQYSQWMTEDDMEEMLKWMKRDDFGNVSADVSLYGMEDYPLSQLQVFDGDLSDVFDPDKRAVAAVYLADDYGNPMEASQWLKTGDTVTVHYVYEWEYYDSETGKKIPEENLANYERPYTSEEKEAMDITYEVAACVLVKQAMSYRYTGPFEFVLNAQVFQKDSRTSDIMTWLCNTAPENSAAMQAYLEDYTYGTNPNLDFESKQVYVQQFEKFRGAFLLMSGVLSGVIGMIGILNFANAVLTSICSRKREFAMMQSVGMTGRQLKRMLICEGLMYGAAAAVVSLVLSFLTIPVFDRVTGSIFWFFTYRFTVLPILAVLPVFAVAGTVLPLFSYRKAVKQTLVERLRENG